MAKNPMGCEKLFDLQYAPSTFTAYAKETISGGEFVFCSGATAKVTSGIDSYTTSDIEVATGASGTNVIGMALHNATSGNPVTIMTRGVVIASCGANIDASQPATIDGSHAVQPATAYGEVVGRTLTAGASGGYLILGLSII